MYPISQLNSFIKSGDFSESDDSRCFLETEVGDLGTSRRLLGDSRRFGRRRRFLVANKLARATLKLFSLPFKHNSKNVPRSQLNSFI